MRVLVACEESQRVCTAFRERGHEAYSCDIIECSGGHPEWHIQCDALLALRGGGITTMDGKTHDIGKWDMVIAHPPCTYLSNAGASRLYRVIDGQHYIIRDRFEKGMDAKEFFLEFLNADIERAVVENPTPSAVFRLPKCTQVIQPYQFGDPYTKRTCLWLKGVPPLQPQNEVSAVGPWVQANGSAWKKKKERGEAVIGAHRSDKIRSKTFPGIAKAMAEQWG